MLCLVSRLADGAAGGPRPGRRRAGPDPRPWSRRPFGSGLGRRPAGHGHRR